MLMKEESKAVFDLESTDTCMILHAAHASRTGSTVVVIVSEDTDVLLLSFALNMDISAAIYQKCCTSTHTRYVDVSKVATTWSPDVCKGLLVMHAFTGCDTISAFAGKGKVGELKLLQKSATTQEMFQALGETWDVQPEMYKSFEKFTALLYGCRDENLDINDLRYAMFCTKKGAIESH